MRKSFLMVPILAVAGWAQVQSPTSEIASKTPVGGFIIPSGTDLKVRVDDTLSSARNERGDPFNATLLEPLVANATTVLPAGTRVSGHVLVNRPAGIFKGRAQLVLSLDSFEYSGNSYPIQMTAATYQVDHKHKNLEDPDPNAGSVTGDREEVTVPAETVIRFTLGAPVLI
jgi:hypothetical protein